MRDDDARGTWTHAPSFLAVPPPRIFFRRREEGRISHSLRRHMHQTVCWMCTVFIASTALCIGALRAALDLARQRGSKAQSLRRPREPPGVFGGGGWRGLRPVPPQNAEYSMLLACVLPRACFNVYVNEIYESCTTLEVWDGAGEAAGGAWSCCALRCC